MAISFLVPLIFSLVYLMPLDNAQDIDHKSKSALVKGILQKVFNLTLTSFANIPIEEREKMMVKIQEKLDKSAKFLGPKSGKYVSIIMEGVKSITSENAELKNIDDIWDVSASVERDERQKGTTKVGKKERYMKKTAEKIKLLADKSIKHAKTPEERKNIMSSIQGKVIESAIKRHTMIKKEDAAFLDRDTIAQVTNRLMKENAKIRNAKKSVSKERDSRRMEFEFYDNINVNKDNNAESSPSKSNEVLEVNSRGDGNKIEPYYKNVTLKLPCLEKKTNICFKIKALRTLKCSGKDISIEKLCNGIDDCFDYSDEQDCAIQGVDKVRKASQMMSEVENSLSNNCYSAKIDHSLIAKQNEILSNVLNSQIKFIHKHANVIAAKSPHSNLRKFYTEPENVRKTVNELAVVITTLSSALEDTLCSNTGEEEFRKFNDIEDIEKEFEHNESVTEKAITWSPHFCKCIEEYCVGECSKNCKKVCLQRYQISRWQCKAISNKETISLDLICDGKLDCYDETDENECPNVPGFAKFEAGNLYNLVFDMITTKTKSANIESVRSKLINLQLLVEDLLKLTSTRKADVLEVKTLRDKCFSVMTAIYDQTWYYAESMAVMHDIYVFLMSVNENLVNAMKLSHIGNDKIIASDGCFCRDNKCALLKCSQTCIHACPAKPKLTRYFCGGSTVMNQSIPIEAICNGNDDCPGKDDEENCSKDICRKHHLVVLRNNLKKATDAQSGTNVGEAFESWKIKVSAKLRIMESNERPTPRVLRDIVNDILHDLVMAYASLPRARRRSSDDAINQFYKTALVVMSSLRSCNK